MFTHIAVVRDLVAMQYKEYQEVKQLNENHTDDIVSNKFFD